MKNSSKVLTALAAGVAAGGVLGVLFAPDKGTVTREKISSNGKKLFKTIQGRTKKEGLNIAKGKLEKHLKKVNTKLQKMSTPDVVPS